MVVISIMCIYVVVNILVHKNPVEIAIVTAKMSSECAGGSNY